MSTERELSPRLRAALRLLLQAWDYAEECRSDPWEFAVEAGDLRALGLTTNDLRYLQHRGYAHHVVEMTKPTDKQRVFGFPDRVVIADKSVFVFTALGANAARLRQPEHVYVQSKVPFYDLDAHQLWFKKHLVKSFRQSAPDQHTILSTFEEEHWTRRIDSPLSPHNFDEDPKLRLRRAIRRLNLHQIHQLINFLADGSGEGIQWQPSSQQASLRRC